MPGMSPFVDAHPPCEPVLLETSKPLHVAERKELAVVSGTLLASQVILVEYEPSEKHELSGLQMTSSCVWHLYQGRQANRKSVSGAVWQGTTMKETRTESE